MKYNRMKLLLLFSFYSLNILAQQNPILPDWYADPEGIKIKNTYWIFPTLSLPRPEQVRFDAFSSKDLVHWKKHANIIDTAAVKWARRAMWAPAVVNKNKKFYFFFAANDVHQGEIGGIGVAVASKPEGPYKDLLGKPLIKDIVNGAQPIDQFVFKDADGFYYMYYGGWKHCNVVKLKDDFTGIIPFPDGALYKEVTPENYVEGPYMLYKGGNYYFMWSEGDWGGPHYKVAYAMSKSPFGPFKRLGTILQQDSTIATGAGHHSILYNNQKKQYYIVYHRRPLNETFPQHRVVCIDELNFSADGKIIPVKMTK